MILKVEKLKRQYSSSKLDPYRELGFFDSDLLIHIIKRSWYMYSHDRYFSFFTREMGLDIYAPKGDVSLVYKKEMNDNIMDILHNMNIAFNCNAIGLVKLTGRKRYSNAKDFILRC